MSELVPSPVLNATLRWRDERLAALPPAAAPWLQDRASLTRRLREQGRFAVRPLYQGYARPSPEERRLLGLENRRRALIREVLLLLDDAPVVYARSVLPIATLRYRGNRALGHMASRSLGAELFRRPKARRAALWMARVPAADLPPELDVSGSVWGRQTRFEKRGRPLLVAEMFLPSLWHRLEISVD